MLSIALSITPILFAFLVIYGALSDLSSFRIPNAVSYGLVLLFVLQLILIWLDNASSGAAGVQWTPVLLHIAIAVVVLFIAIVFWRRGYIGGGDAKYLAATSLWMGPLGVVQFMVLLSGLALIMALFLKLSARWSFLVHAGNLPHFVKRLYAKFEEKQLPYGFPIGLAALAMIPRIFNL